MKVTVFDVNALCREMVEFLQPQNAFDKGEARARARRRRPRRRGRCGANPPVVLNLCRNAAEALARRRVEEARIWIRTRNDGKGYIRVEVDDNGRGVPEPSGQRIFEPGFTTKATGHGFGLATCARIAEAHKGGSRVESGRGRGPVHPGLASW